MASKIAQIAQTFLNELNSGDSRESVDTLKILIEELETKTDPDPIEVRLVANLTDFLEKYEVMRSNVRSYVRDSQDNPGHKLDSLYENRPAAGTSRLFKS